jgi:hypothetical protein
VQEPDLLSLFVKPLEKAGMRYLVAGKSLIFTVRQPTS